MAAHPRSSRQLTFFTRVWSLIFRQGWAATYGSWKPLQESNGDCLQQVTNWSFRDEDAGGTPSPTLESHNNAESVELCLHHGGSTRTILFPVRLLVLHHQK